MPGRPGELPEGIEDVSVMTLSDLERRCNAIASAHEFLDAALEEVESVKGSQYFTISRLMLIAADIRSLLAKTDTLFAEEGCRE
jgi:hypothetical protein